MLQESLAWHNFLIVLQGARAAGRGELRAGAEGDSGGKWTFMPGFLAVGANRVGGIGASPQGVLNICPCYFCLQLS